MSDHMRITILADGTLKTETDSVSDANHSLAEDFLAFVARLTGGPVTRDSRPDAEHLQHDHSHDGEHHHH